MPTPSFDAIVVGGGHNGLAAAALLGQAGRRVLLLEASDAVGGAARTVALAPGFRVPEIAHLANRLHPEIVRKLDLERHGLALRRHQPLDDVAVGGRPAADARRRLRRAAGG
jgi:phytoene dehydrogenase-like protein